MYHYLYIQKQLYQYYLINQIGFIAQNVESVFPELVLTDNNDIKSVNYSQMTAVLLEAIKDQNKIISQLRDDIELLKNKK